MNIDYNLMGSRLCQRRKELHLTQKELAEKVNISNIICQELKMEKKGQA